MKIYIACLAAYNSGHLHGKWIDVSSDAEEMEKEAQKVIKTSPVPDAEEWAIHDYDNFPNMGEYVGLEKIAEITDMIESSDQDADVVKAVIDNFSSDEIFMGAAQHVLDENCGIHDNFQAYADWFADQMMACHDFGGGEWIKQYFDYDKHAEALSYDYIQIEVKGGVLIAPNR